MTTPDFGFTHRFVAGAGSAPTLLLLHDIGGDENAILDLGRVLAPGAALLSPRGQVQEDSGPRFCRMTASGFDTEDLLRRTGELVDFVELASNGYSFDPQQVIVVGYAHGATIAASMLLLRPDGLRAGVLFHPAVPFEPEAPPFLTQTSVFIAASRYSQFAPPAQSQQLVAIFEAAGADVTLHWYTDDPPSMQAEIQPARAWLRHKGHIHHTEHEGPSPLRDRYTS